MITLTDALRGDDGMSTAEYAIGTLAAAALATALYLVLTSDTMSELLKGLIERALSVTA
jgi:hypothetical protein